MYVKIANELNFCLYDSSLVLLPYFFLIRMVLTLGWCSHRTLPNLLIFIVVLFCGCCRLYFLELISDRMPVFVTVSNSTDVHVEMFYSNRLFKICQKIIISKTILQENGDFLSPHNLCFTLYEFLGGKLVVSECMVSLLCVGKREQDGGENRRS